MKLIIAIPKGRLFGESIELFREKELIKEDLKEGRKLIIDTEYFRILFVKPFDVPIYVEQGVADVGIAGRDVLLEKNPDVYRILDLEIGKCSIVVAGKPEDKIKYKNYPYLRIATKYPNVSRTFFERKGVKTKIIHLSGSVEIAPLLGLADFIVDIVQTGRTLKENGLVIVDKIEESTAYLIVNKISFYYKRERILNLIERLQ